MNRVFTRLFVFALCAVLTLVGLPVRAHQAPVFTPEQVRNLVLVGQIRGHLAVSLLNWQAADYTLALKHANHVKDELITPIEADLKKANLDAQLKTDLDAYIALIDKANDKDKVQQAFTTLASTLEKISAAFAPAAAFDDVTFRLSVAQGLLAAIEREYEEGVADGKITNIVEYQDSVGFLSIAKEHYTAIQPKVKALSAELDQTISKQYEALSAALPGIKPPEKLVDPAQIEGIVDLVKDSVKTTLKIDLEVKRTVADIIMGTRMGLMKALEDYQTGKTDDAYEAASSAYLDNYEGIEADLRKKDSALTDLLEKQIVDFGKMIKAGKTLDELKALYAQIDANLSKAQELLKES